MVFADGVLTNLSKACVKCNSRSECVCVCRMDSTMASHADVDERAIAGACETAVWRSLANCTKLKIMKF